MAIRDRLTDGSVPLTRADLKVARALLGNYPAAGLNTVAHLAQAAAVSAPTVVRFVTRLGFDSYAGFQRCLLDEVQERLSSPLAMLAAGKGREAREGHYRDGLHAAVAALDLALDMVPAAEFEALVAALATAQGRIWVTGGRFSGYLAGMLWAHLRQLRPDCHWLTGTRADQVDQMVDLGRRDLLIAYDYRRYQTDTIGLARAAAAQGARIALFTDRWLSPIAEVADWVLTAPVDGPSPFDTMVPALAQTEALIAALTARLADASRGRIERMEDLRRAAAITENPLPAGGLTETLPPFPRPDGEMP